MMGYTRTRKLIEYFQNRLDKKCMADLARSVLVSLADEQGWEIKNPDSIKYYNVKPIYRTS